MVFNTLIYAALRSSHGCHGGGGLDVVAVQVALEVEVSQGLAVANGQELLQGGIGLDVVLVLQALLLHVVVHGLGHLRAGHQSTVGLAQELAQLVSHLGGALKDAGGTRLGVRALLDLHAALALASILQLAVDTLLQLLHLVEHGRHSLLQGVQVTGHGLDVLIQSGGGHHGGSHGGHLHGGGAHNSRGDSLGLGGLLWGHLNRGSNSHGGGGSLLLGDLLGCGGSLGGGSGAHLYTGSGGSIRGHYTRGSANKPIVPGHQFWRRQPPFFLPGD